MFDLILRKQSKECCSHRGQCQYRNGMPVQPPMCPEKVICTINHRSSKECCSIRAYTTSFNMKSLEGSLGGQMKKYKRRALHEYCLYCLLTAFIVQRLVSQSLLSVSYTQKTEPESQSCTCQVVHALRVKQVPAGPSKGRHSWPSLTRATSCSATNPKLLNYGFQDRLGCLTCRLFPNQQDNALLVRLFDLSRGTSSNFINDFKNPFRAAQIRRGYFEPVTW